MRRHRSFIGVGRHPANNQALEQFSRLVEYNLLL